jgi:ubiquinone/menaquinone biosynthesis C-methylase UbiE
VPDRDAAFVGTIPPIYDRHLGPLFFQPYADDLAARLVPTPDMRVLEVACGTGLVTRRLLERLGGSGSILATDLNEPMLAYGRSQIPGAPGLQWRQADAMALPVPDRAFDAVVCGFGLLLFPDKAAAIRETFRVLRPGGTYLFNAWGPLADNPAPRIAHETVATFFPSDPPQFYTVPFSCHDPAEICRWLADAGFTDVTWTSLPKTGSSPSAAEAAIGLIEGNPIGPAIVERRADAVAEIERAVAARIAVEVGDHPVRVPLRAVVFSARRP